MLKEALQYLMGQSADTRKAGIRILKTPGAIPGQVTLFNANDKGVYEQDTIFYPLARKQYQARTIEGFCGFIFNSLPATVDDKGEKREWHVMIGDKEVVGYRVVGTSYEEADVVILLLSETDEYVTFCNEQGWKPAELKRTIERMFTDKDDIYRLVPLLSKISVREEKTMSQTNNKNNDSLGMDVQRSLTLSDYQSELPSTTFVRVSKFDEVDCQCTIDINIHFDFDTKLIVFTPKNYSLRAADILTSNEIRKMVSKGEPIPIISEVEILNPSYPGDAALLS